jgi:hypothetical protein
LRGQIDQEGVKAEGIGGVPQSDGQLAAAGRQRKGEVAGQFTKVICHYYSFY